MNASLEELTAVPDVGGVIAQSVWDYFQEERHREEVHRLQAAGLQMSLEKKEAASTALSGKTIVISGNFSISRDAMKALIEANGGKNSTSVSSKTSWLLAGEKPGPEKLRKAGELGVPVIDEETFRGLIAGASEEPAAPSQPKEEPEEPNLFSGLM